MRKRREMIRRIGLTFASAIGATIACLAMSGASAFAQCPDESPAPPPRQVSHEGVRIGGLDLVCYPPLISSTEGVWTFYLRGSRAFLVTRARLEVGGRRYPAAGIEYPTPTATLIDVAYPRLATGETALLIVEGDRGLKAAYSISVDYPQEIPDSARQPDRVRVQLKRWTLFYPSGPEAARIPPEGIARDELYGEETFMNLLRDLSVRTVRKVIHNWAEDDSVHWDAKNQRELVQSGDHLRQYLLFVRPGRSEHAYKEILLAFPEVEGAYINAAAH